jgi:hypothetical protein
MNSPFGKYVGLIQFDESVLVGPTPCREILAFATKVWFQASSKGKRDERAGA